VSFLGSPIPIYKLSTRMPDRPHGGGPVRLEVEDSNNLRSSGCRHLLILVHGFNNSAATAKASFELQLGCLEEHFRSSPRYAPDAIAFFHWPGDVGGVGSLAAYPLDIPRALASAERLADYLKNFPSAANPGALKISLIGHSLGCRLILEMLSKNLPIGLALNIEVVSLLAPAVPIELVAAPRKLEVSVRSPRRVLKCYSHQDWALWIGFPQGQQAAFAIREEDEFFGEAVGLYGHPTPMGISIETKNGHSDYWGDRNVANRFSAAIDPTFYTLPPPRGTSARGLPNPYDSPIWSLAGAD
jgi:pimeloyl-ACP methyl ester carboxylesterase